MWRGRAAAAAAAAALALLSLLLLPVPSSSFVLQCVGRGRASSSSSSSFSSSLQLSSSSKTEEEKAEERQREIDSEWAEDGRRGRVLKRKKDLPAAELSPLDVCDKVLRALQLNDDPILDYGAAVMVRFASKSSAMSKLTPSEYGKYLRSSELEILVENSRFAPLGPTEITSDGSRAAQRLGMVGPPPDLEKSEIEIVLSQEEVEAVGLCWLIDAVALV
jgi:hypothetical protein